MQGNGEMNARAMARICSDFHSSVQGGGPMTQVLKAAAATGPCQIEANAIILQREIKDLGRPSDIHAHGFRLGMAGDVVNGFFEKQKDVPVEVERGGGRRDILRSMKFPGHAAEQAAGPWRPNRLFTLL